MISKRQVVFFSYDQVLKSATHSELSKIKQKLQLNGPSLYDAYEWAFSPLDTTARMGSPLALAIDIFFVWFRLCTDTGSGFESKVDELPTSNVTKNPFWTDVLCVINPLCAALHSRNINTHTCVLTCGYLWMVLGLLPRWPWVAASGNRQSVWPFQRGD